MCRGALLVCGILLVAASADSSTSFTQLLRHGRMSPLLRTGEPCSSAENRELTCDKTCSYLYKCINNQEILIEHCGSEKACYQPDLSCRDVNICPVADKKITCRAKNSVFPDPLDCYVYHECGETIGDLSVRKDCPDDKSFSVASKTCDGTSEDRACKSSPVPYCLTQGQTGALRENKQYYYVCLKEGDFLEPRMFKCKNGEHYNEEAGQCLEKTTVLTCTEEGRFPDPEKCQTYHECAGPNVDSVPTKCPTGSAFNVNDGECSLSESDAICSSGPVPKCTKLGHTGPLSYNTQYYFKCFRQDTLFVPRLYKCAFGLTFDETTLQCEVAKPNPIRCTSEGRFPDPSACTFYHECASGATLSTPTYCNGYAFDLATMECKTTTSGATCAHAPLPLCSVLGERGKLKDNASYYYLCMMGEAGGALEPTLFKCATGMTYNENTLECSL